MGMGGRGRGRGRQMKGEEVEGGLDEGREAEGNHNRVHIDLG